MLVLSRKLSERIFIGDEIVVTIVRIRGGNIRVGVDAPKNMRISRADPECPGIARNEMPESSDVCTPVSDC